MTNVTDFGEVNITIWNEYVENVLIIKSITSTSILYLTPLLSIIFVASFVGNFLTCIVIYCDRSMHTATNYYLFNLAITDLLVSFAILIEIIHLHYSYRTGYYTFGDITCKIYFFLIIIMWNSGIITMTVLAIERYIAVFHPMILKTSSVSRRVFKIIAIIWVLALIETLPEMWTVYLVRTEITSLCFIIPTHFARIINGMLAVLTFLIPLMIMAVLYTMIAIKVNIVQRNSAKEGRTFNHRDSSRKVNKLVIALTLAFVVCWVPFFMIRIYIALWNTDRYIDINEWWVTWSKFCMLNNWCSTVINPLLFSLMSTKFRQALKGLWQRKIKRQSRPISSMQLTDLR